MLKQRRHIKLSYRSEGFTFTELLIALAINTVLLAAMVTMFGANISYFKTAVNVSRLNQQLQSAMSMMTNDIRRAGYWGNAQTDLGSNTNNNPFMAVGTDVTVSGSNDCVLLTYDKDQNGAIPAISSTIDDERYGFRLLNQAIQARPPGATFACDAAATSWENITDPGIVQITGLTFALVTKTVSAGGGKSLTMRSIDISITGRLSSDTSITKTVTQHVRVRNDKYA